jgi:cobalamin-dependent methionine synthase I
VFLKEAVDRGLDSAIVNYAKIYPVFRIPQIEVDLARKLVFRDESAGDPLKTYTPLDLINTVLLDGMKTVGELFGARKMRLPSVLDSAGVMKASVGYLEPKIKKVEGLQKGTIMLATVKGDVRT